MTTKSQDMGGVIADRRSFLKLAGATAAAGGAAVLPVAATAQSGPRESTQLYRETEHIRRYYELAR